MQFTTFAAAALLAASASAYSVLTPALNSTITKGETISVEWSAVDTDAETFSIFLTNFDTVHWPPTVLSLAQNVPRDDLSIDIRIPCDLSSDYGWQLNFINGTNTYVIYAQSEVFELTGDCVEPTSSAPPFPTTTGYTNTTTVYGTVTQVATTTATVIKAVSTVVYATPIVWFVEPSKQAGKETVTVFPSTCEAKPTGPVAPVVPKPATTTKAVLPTGTGGYSPTSPPQFTGAASSVKVSGAMAMIVGAVAFML